MPLLTSDLAACLVCFSTLHIVGSLLFKLPSMMMSHHDPFLALHPKEMLLPGRLPDKTLECQVEIAHGKQLPLEWLDTCTTRNVNCCDRRALGWSADSRQPRQQQNLVTGVVQDAVDLALGDSPQKPCRCWRLTCCYISKRFVCPSRSHAHKLHRNIHLGIYILATEGALPGSAVSKENLSDDVIRGRWPSRIRPQSHHLLLQRSN